MSSWGVMVVVVAVVLERAMEAVFVELPFHNFRVTKNSDSKVIVALLST
jgi:hypothetical protein